MKIHLASAALVACVLTSSAPAQDERADLSRLVVVGDSLSAGFQNGSLHEAFQPNGFTSLIAARAGVALDLPLIAAPGIPNALVLIDPGPPPELGVEPGVSTGRTDPTVQATNLAVPGHDVGDALLSRPDLPVDDLTDLVLGLPGLLQGISRSQVEWAEALAPTTIVLWLGSNDTLGAAVEADSDLVTDADEFRTAFGEVIERLAATGATLVVGNIPDVTVIPYLTTAEELAALVGFPLEVIGLLLGVGPGDFVTPDAFELVGLILQGMMSGPLPPDVVLTAGEVEEIRAATAEFNDFIAQQAHAHGAGLVDLHGLLDSLDCRGRVIGGQLLTTDFLGGLFSLDGIHPTNTAHALVANEFIAVLNRRFRAGILPIPLRRIMNEDPLVFPNPPTGVEPPCSMSRERGRSLRAVLRP